MKITFTGIDEKTDCGELHALMTQYEYVEIGFLYTQNPEGRPRYPQLNFVRRASAYLQNTSIHICGNKAREQLLRGELDSLVLYSNRIQVNGILSVEQITNICLEYPTHEIITQHNDSNVELLKATSPNHSILIDGSGGKGISPKSWSSIKINKKVGFAGGLGPDNFVEELEKIRKVAKDGAWIDMENKLRVNDWFSIDKVREILFLADCYFYD